MLAKLALTSLVALMMAQSAPVPTMPSNLTAADEGFRRYLDAVADKAQARGVRRQTIDEAFAGLTANQRVIDLDRAQPGGAPGGPIPAFAPYRATHVDARRIERGRAAYQALRPFLAAVERDTGVPEEMMVAIWGKETNYGIFVGDFDLVRSLATLAWEGRRRALFEGELIAVLQLLDRGIPRERLKGSWAGATGHPQFLPSVIMKMGRDGDGDGRVDVWSSEADALASIANYFRQAGWRPGERWGAAVAVPGDLDRSAIASRTTAPRCPRVHARHSRWLTVNEWQARGVRFTGPALSPPTLATLIEPDGPGEPAFLLTQNYRTILDYNCSNFYGLTVGLLADGIAS